MKPDYRKESDSIFSGNTPKKYLFLGKSFIQINIFVKSARLCVSME